MNKLFFSMVFFLLFQNAFAQPEYSEISVAWSYDEERKNLDIVFSLSDAALSPDADAAFVLTDFSASTIVGQGTLSSPLPQTISFSGVEPKAYSLVLNNFLTKKQTVVEINITKPLQGIPSPSCSSRQGFLCRENEACPSATLSASDGLCCSVQCKAKPAIKVLPVFGNALIPVAAVVILILVLYYWGVRKHA